MEKEELKKRVKVFAEISESIPERYREICFEKLLIKYLHPDEKPSINGPNKSGDSTPSVTQEISDIYTVEGDEIKVLCQLPGSSQKDKTISAALLVLHGRLSQGIEWVPTSEIRQVCKEHGALNVGNFAAFLKSEKKLLLLRGKGKKNSAKLTQPGKRKAEEIIGELHS